MKKEVVLLVVAIVAAVAVCGSIAPSTAGIDEWGKNLYRVACGHEPSDACAVTVAR